MLRYLTKSFIKSIIHFRNSPLSSFRGARTMTTFAAALKIALCTAMTLALLPLEANAQTARPDLVGNCLQHPDESRKQIECLNNRVQDEIRLLRGQAKPAWCSSRASSMTGFLDDLASKTREELLNNNAIARICNAL